MPIGEYFHGHGSEVMSGLRKAHPGNKKLQKRIFYATANKLGENRPGKRKKRRSASRS